MSHGIWHAMSFLISSTDSQVFVQVVVGVIDPNPKVGGQGVVRLQEAGITADGPCLRKECYDINSDFMERMATESV